MADPATVAVLANIAEYAGYVEAIVSAIKTAQEVLGQPDKQQDEATKIILESIARAEASIKDEIHTAILNTHIGAVEDASRFWGNNWLYIVRGKNSSQQLLAAGRLSFFFPSFKADFSILNKVGITFANLESNGALHGVELDMAIKRNNVSQALTHFHQARETLPPTPGMLKILLGSYSLYLSMETVWTTFTWVRNLHRGDPTPPKELLNHTAVLDLGCATIEAWLAGYKLFRRSQIQINIDSTLASDEAHPPLKWEFEYLVQQDLGGDTIIGKIEPGTNLAYIGPRAEAPKPDVYEPKIINSLQCKWGESENGGKAVEAVFRNWNGVKTQVGLLLRPA